MSKKNKQVITEFATLSAYTFGEHRVDGEPITGEENASIAESYAMIGRMLQELASQGVTAGSKLLLSIEVVKTAKPEPKGKAKPKQKTQAAR